MSEPILLFCLCKTDKLHLFTNKDELAIFLEITA